MHEDRCSICMRVVDDGVACGECSNADDLYEEIATLKAHGKRLRRLLVEVVGDPVEAWQNANGTDITKKLATLLRVTAYLDAAPEAK